MKKMTLYILILTLLVQPGFAADYDSGQYPEATPIDTNSPSISVPNVITPRDVVLPSTTPTFDSSTPVLKDISWVDQTPFTVPPTNFQINFGSEDFTLATQLPLTSLTNGVSIDGMMTGLGALAFVANNSSSSLTISSLSQTGANSLLAPDLSLFNDKAVETRSIIEVVTASNTASLNNTLATGNTKALLASMQMDELRTDGFDFYLADGTQVGSTSDILVAQAAGGTIMDVGCRSPVAGICVMIAALQKARADGQAAIDKAYGGNPDPYDLFGPQSQSRPGYADRWVAYFKDLYNSYFAPTPQQSPLITTPNNGLVKNPPLVNPTDTRANQGRCWEL